MTREQIDILVKDKDIWPYNTDYACNNFPEDKSFVYEEIEYAVSHQLKKILHDLFNYYLKDNTESTRHEFKTYLKNENEFNSPLREHRLSFYNDEIKKQRAYFTEYKNEIDQKYDIEVFTFNEALNYWYSFLSVENDIFKLISTLKFDVLGGEKIELFTLRRAVSSRLIDNFFSTRAMVVLYTVVSIGEKTKYLQTLISEIDQPVESGLQQTDIAIICILKKIDLYDLDNCRQTMTKYNEKLSLKQAPKLRDKYKDLYVKGDLIKTHYTKKSEAEKVISSLKKITSFLNEVEKEVANNTIDTIEDIK